MDEHTTVSPWERCLQWATDHQQPAEAPMNSEFIDPTEAGIGIQVDGGHE